MDEVSSHVCLVLPSTDGKAARKIVPPRLRIPYWKGLGADSEEKHEPVSDIDTVVVDSLKALDPKRPIREAVSPLPRIKYRPEPGNERNDGHEGAVFSKPGHECPRSHSFPDVLSDHATGFQVVPPWWLAAVPACCSDHDLPRA